MRPIAPRETSDSSIFGNAFIGAVIGVSISPGATALTRMFSATQCTARLRVRAMRAAFAAEYPGTIVDERNAAIDTRFTTLAPPCIVLAARAARALTVRRIAPSRLRFSEAENPSGLHSSNPSGNVAPALFTNTSSFPRPPASASTASLSRVSNCWNVNAERSVS